MIKKKEEKDTQKKVIELTFEDVIDSNKYLGKIKIADMENEDYILTLYNKGSIHRKLRRIGVVDSSEERVIRYREVL